MKLNTRDKDAVVIQTLGEVARLWTDGITYKRRESGRGKTEFIIYANQEEWGRFTVSKHTAGIIEIRVTSHKYYRRFMELSTRIVNALDTIDSLQAALKDRNSNLKPTP